VVPADPANLFGGSSAGQVLNRFSEGVAKSRFNGDFGRHEDLGGFLGLRLPGDCALRLAVAGEMSKSSARRAYRTSSQNHMVDYLTTFR